MRNLFLLFIVCAILGSCTKTKTNTVTVTKNDTTTIAIYPNLIGTWQSSTGSSPIVFDTSTYQIQSYTALAYIASPDTIFDVSASNVIYPIWAYTISGNNDTLSLTAVTPGSATYVYLRSN